MLPCAPRDPPWIRLSDTDKANTVATTTKEPRTASSSFRFIVRALLYLLQTAAISGYDKTRISSDRTSPGASTMHDRKTTKILHRYFGIPIFMGSSTPHRLPRVDAVPDRLERSRYFKFAHAFA